MHEPGLDHRRLDPEDRPRCAIVLDEELTPGRAANAAAVIALTVGALVPDLQGEDVVDADGAIHPGLIPIGLPVLKAPAGTIGALRERAVEAGLVVVDFPAPGQQTTDYEAFRHAVSTTRAAELEYVGVAVIGPKKRVARITGQLALLR